MPTFQPFNYKSHASVTAEALVGMIEKPKTPLSEFLDPAAFLSNMRLLTSGRISVKLAEYNGENGKRLTLTPQTHAQSPKGISFTVKADNFPDALASVLFALTNVGSFKDLAQLVADQSDYAEGVDAPKIW